MRRAKSNSLEKILILGKIEGKRRRQWQRMRLLDGITDSEDMNLNKLRETVQDRGAWHAVVHEVTKSWTWLNSNNNINSKVQEQHSGQEFFPQRDLTMSIQFPNCDFFLTFGKLLVQIWDVNISSACGALLEERDSFSYETSPFYTLLIM